MKKIVLTFTGIASKKEVHRYLKERLELPEYYGGNLDALYDCLTDICEPTVFGIFLPLSDDAEPDIELLYYLEKVKNIFLMAERDNGEYLAVMTDEDVFRNEADFHEEENDIAEEEEEENEEDEDPEEDPDRILSDFFASLDPQNRKK